MHVRYNPDTKALAGRPRATAYNVDGKPADLPEPWVELQLIEQPRPEVPEGKRLEPSNVADLDAKTYTRGWVIVDLPPEMLARMKREELRTALRAKFAAVTDPRVRGPLRPAFTAISSAFDDGEPLAVIREIIEAVDVEDTEYLQVLKTEMLALPQWQN